MIYKAFYIFITILFLFLQPFKGVAQSNKFSNWKTNTSKKSIALSELRSGGPPKDGIPSIDNPKFISKDNASWLTSQEPVIAVVKNGVAKAYPLQILIWHEIVNDQINGEPILVTFCPLCYSALTFIRVIEGETHSFGVSGFLRHSDLVMFDRKTESLWQQFNGKAIVGDYTGKQLEQIPSQIISFEQFKQSYPGGQVLSKDTGYRRDYGRNPYTGYDNINNTPFMLGKEADNRLPPMEKVVGVKLDEQTKTYPYSVSKNKHVINDEISDTPIVIFHQDGATSALDKSSIAQSKEAGSTGVFRALTGNRKLTFRYQNGKIIDDQTRSIWNITGKAVEGELEGTQLEPVTFGDYFAFAWLVFYPDTKIYTQ